MRRAHLVPARVDGGQAQVSVERRVALAREMLGARRDAALLHALDPRDAVARDHLRILAVRADPDVGAVPVREDVEYRSEVHVHAQTAQLARLEEALAIRERLFARRAGGQVVGEDRRGATQHHDAAALVIGGDEEPSAQRGLELGQQVKVLLGGLEVPPIEDEPAGAGLAEEADVFVGELGSAEPEHEPLADEVLEVGHNAIIGRVTHGPADLTQWATALSGG